MSEFLEIKGGIPLSGSVAISGAKNAALPMMIASLLTSEPCEFKNVPNLEDVNLTIHLLEQFGSTVEHNGDYIKIATPRLIATEASYSLVKALRASFWVLGPLLARGRAARVALPGGDLIGARPVDLHLAALTKMGADIKLKHGTVFATAVNGLKPAQIELRFPSVGATHQIMMAAALTVGTTTISGAAREPEIVALADMINSMGGSVEGAGSDRIAITGRETLAGAKVNLIGDRIETATYLLAGVITSGSVRCEGVDPLHLGNFLAILAEMGCLVESGEDFVAVKRTGPILPVHVATAPFPGFATDIQAPLIATLSLAQGESTLEENIFEGRFGHVSELCRLGAAITVQDRVATIRGVPKLTAAQVEVMDIRAGAALVVAALAAEGTTQIYEIQHLRRGYDSLESKLRKLGAQVGQRFTDLEELMSTGC